MYGVRVLNFSGGDFPFAWFPAACLSGAATALCYRLVEVQYSFAFVFQLLPVVECYEVDHASVLVSAASTGRYSRSVLEAGR